ncbi:AbrB/MazE/SpoVT family DNA-binding domain-containing protein [Salinithrix halophila]|uniref:AbrB/MazE/SpoVT family DNA-binding domain-containing protein n=1 Tax=Salinithrix halophila TaxID=1485204 RepID=A0ABV8JJT7_9BACL
MVYRPLTHGYFGLKLSWDYVYLNCWQRVTAKGQITIPKSVRQQLDLEEGDRVVFVEEDGKMVVKKGRSLLLRILLRPLAKRLKRKELRKRKF